MTRPSAAWVDATATRERLVLLATEHTHAEIAEGLGISPRLIRWVLAGQATVHRATERLVLTGSPRPRSARAHDLVDATTSHRALGGLLALGWPRAWIAAQLGVKPGTVDRWRRQSVLRRRVADQVVAFGLRVGDAWGPDRSVAARAKAAGCVVPAYWDEGYADPSPVEPIAVKTGAADDLPLAEQIQRLTEDQGLSARVIAEQLGVTRRTVVRYRNRMRTRQTQGVAA